MMAFIDHPKMVVMHWICDQIDLYSNIDWAAIFNLIEITTLFAFAWFDEDFCFDFHLYHYCFLLFFVDDVILTQARFVDKFSIQTNNNLQLQKFRLFLTIYREMEETEREKKKVKWWEIPLSFGIDTFNWNDFTISISVFRDSDILN